MVVDRVHFLVAFGLRASVIYSLLAGDLHVSCFIGLSMVAGFHQSEQARESKTEAGLLVT